MYVCIGDVFLSGCVRCTTTEFSIQPVVVYLDSVVLTAVTAVRSH